MPKNWDDLKKSRERRKEIVAKYGCVPTSIWEGAYSHDIEIIEYEDRKRGVIGDKRHEKMDYDKSDKELVKAFGASSRTVRGTSEDSIMSTFPPNLVKRVVEFYSEPGEIVLDPMAGHNSRMQMTHLCNRNYIGYDVSHKFMEFNREVADKITGKGEQNILVPSPYTITLREQSSEQMVEADNSVDLCFTSPPYYKVEFYTDEKDQMYYSKDYDEFLNRIEKVLSECYRVLKPNKYCVWNINDFRYGNRFYPYHADIIRIMNKVGFRMWDCIIVKWPSSIQACFATQIEDRKMSAKMHEYLIVGKKVVKEDGTPDNDYYHA